VTSAVVVVLPAGIVVVEMEDVDVPGPVDVVVEGKIPADVVEEDAGSVVVVDERDEEVDDVEGIVDDEVDDEVVEP
jgi:hypothetical protein